MNWLGFNLKSIYSAFILKDIFAEYKIPGWQFFFSVLAVVTWLLVCISMTWSATLPWLFCFIVGFQQCSYAVPWCSLSVCCFLPFLLWDQWASWISELTGFMTFKNFWPVLQMFFLCSLSFWRDSIYTYVRSLSHCLMGHWCYVHFFFFSHFFSLCFYFG